MKQLQVSVVMGVYNSEDFVKEAIQSVLNQTYEDLEFIVINDGSTDNTLQVLKKFRDPRLKIINQKNIGLTKSLNKGIKMAEGKYIARQDADDISSPERLYKQLKIMEKYEDVGIVASNFVVFSVKHFLEGILKPDIKKFPKKNVFAHGSLMFRSELLRNNLYNDKFLYKQDYELLYRLYRQTKIYIIPEVLYYHRKELVYNFEKFIYQTRINYRSFYSTKIPSSFILNKQDIPSIKKNIKKEYYQYWASILRKNFNYKKAFDIYRQTPKPYDIVDTIKYCLYASLYFLHKIK